jgi:hypothetical protein
MGYVQWGRPCTLPLLLLLLLLLLLQPLALPCVTQQVVAVGSVLVYCTCWTRNVPLRRACMLEQLLWLAVLICQTTGARL